MTRLHSDLTDAFGLLVLAIVLFPPLFILADWLRSF